MGDPPGRGTSGECGYGLWGLRRRGARECAPLQPRPPRTVALLVPLVYSRGKWGTRLAQMLERRLLFSHILPINGLCFYGLCRPHLRPL